MMAYSKIALVKLLALIAAVLLPLVAASANSQETSQAETNERLLACGNIADQAKRVACFDAVVQGLQQAPVAPVAEVPAEVPADPAKTAAADTAAITAPAVAPGPAAVQQEKQAVAPSAAPDALATARQPDAPAAAAPTDTSGTAATAAATTAPATVSPHSAADKFGLEDEYVAEQKAEVQTTVQEIDTIHATIAEVWSTIDDRFEVRLDNGQVWRETELTRRTRMPEVGSTVRITRASLGSFRMKIGNDNRLSAVRRTQ
jgi:hypothetical protein